LHLFAAQRDCRKALRWENLAKISYNKLKTAKIREGTWKTKRFPMYSFYFLGFFLKRDFFDSFNGWLYRRGGQVDSADLAGAETGK
jgi:hypothetical protein